MADFILTAVSPEPRIWKGDHGDFAIYEVSFEGEQGHGKAELKQKASTPAPSVGQTLDAEIVQKPGRPAELKKVWKQGGSSNGGGKRGTDYRTPEQIMRGYCHTHALRYWELKHAADPTFRFGSWSAYIEIVDLFYSDITGAS